MSVSKDGRVRNFATVVYQDSAPPNWVAILQSHFIPCFISPYHDSDINPTGEPKKPHWHVLVMFDGKKSIEQARELFSTFNGVGCEVVNSIRGYARYLCHLDNPEKYQYKVEDVRSLCGADYISTIGLSIDKYKTIAEIMDFCDKKQIFSYKALLQYCRVERYDWFRVLCDNGTYVILEYLKSSSWEHQSALGVGTTAEKQVDWWKGDVQDL